jgi:proteasome lid subunit RPN8/RPN11
MTLVVPAELLTRIEHEGERAYPEESAGFLLGVGSSKVVTDILPARNVGVDGIRRNRYLIGPDAYLGAELEAERRALDVLGVFHSHPDHPEEPSPFDLEWAQPSFSYLITSIRVGTAVASRSWLLAEDRSRFQEEALSVTPSVSSHLDRRPE